MKVEVVIWAPVELTSPLMTSLAVQLRTRRFAGIQVRLAASWSL